MGMEVGIANPFGLGPPPNWIIPPYSGTGTEPLSRSRVQALWASSTVALGAKAQR